MGRFSLRVFSALLLLALPAAAAAQTAAPLQPQEVKKLDFLVGEWKGKGWLIHADGKRSELTQRTKVESKSGDSLRIKGEARYKKHVVIYDTINATFLPTNITVFFDRPTGQYKWRRESGQGRKSSYEAKLVEPKTLHLYPPSGGTRSVITITEGGEWHETFEIWTDGKWRKFMETVLQRVK